MRTAKPISEQPVEHQALLSTAAELLNAGQYDQVAEVLARAQLASEQRGEELPARILDMARQICLACSQSEAEAEWHRRALHEVVQREDKLRHQLSALLDLVGERDLSVVPAEWDQFRRDSTAALGPSEPGLARPTGPPSLRQRIQEILHRRPGPQPQTKVITEAPVSGTALLTPGRAASKVPPAAKEAERPSWSPVKIAHGLSPSLVQTAAETESSPASPRRETGVLRRGDRVKPKQPSPPSLVVYCLGPFRVFQDDHPITEWESLKARSILKYLVAHHGTPIVKDVLMDVFWKDADPEAARRNLHQAVYSLRKTLRQQRPDFPYVWFEGDRYLLNPDTSVWLDFEQFEKCVRNGQGLEAAGQLAEAIAEYGIAEGLYQGDFLEEDLYEDWPVSKRQHLRTLYVQMGDRLSQHYMHNGDLAAAIVLCRKILSLDSCWEEAHRRLMQCYLAQGQRHLAVRQYQACVQALSEELELAPSEETVELYRRITTRV